MTFGSTHKVLKAEKSLKMEDIKFRLDPPPKFIKRENPRCSLVITIEEVLLESTKPVLEKDEVPPVKVYKETGGEVEFKGEKEKAFEDITEDYF